MAPALRDRLTADGLDEDARRNLAALIEAQRACTGAVPTDRRLVVETCPDETGDMRVILHSPFGRRVHEPWALAVAHRVTTAMGFDPQAVASDDGIVLRVPAAEDALPGSDLFRFDSDELESIVRERVGFTALFAARFRECAARALLMSPTAPGKRAPLWQQRLKGGQLFGGGPARGGFHPSFWRPCASVCRRVRPVGPARGDGRSCLGFHQDERSSHGRHRRRSRRRSCSGIWASTSTRAICPMPSGRRRFCPWIRRFWASFWAPVLWRMCWMQRWWRAPWPSCSGRPMVGRRGVRKAWPIFCASWGRLRWRRLPLEPRAAKSPSFSRTWKPPIALSPPSSAARRGGLPLMMAPRLSAVLGICGSPLGPARGKAVPPPGRTCGPLRAHPRAFRQRRGRMPPWGSAWRLRPSRWNGWPPRGVSCAWGPTAGPTAPCSPACASRSLARAREAVRPVPADAYVRFLLDRQDIARAGEPTLAGVDGVAQVIAQFEGAALPMEQWEREVLPARVPDYRPAMLDELIAAGEVLWAASTVGEAHPISFFPTDSPLAPLPVDAQAGVAEVSAAEPGELEDPSLDAIVRHVLVAQGPLTFRALTDGAAQLAGPVARTDREVAEALQRLVWKGEATSDGLGFPRAGGLAAAASASAAGGQTPPPSRRRASSRRGRSLHSEAPQGRPCGRGGPPGCVDRLRRRSRRALVGPWRRVARVPRLQAVALVESLLDRYGVVTRDIVLAAGVPGGLSMLYPVLKAMEEARRSRARHVSWRAWARPSSPSARPWRPCAPSPSLRTHRRPPPSSRFPPTTGMPLRCRHSLARCGMGRGGRGPCGGFRARGCPPPLRREGALVVIADGSPVLWGRAAPEIAAGVFRRRKNCWRRPLPPWSPRCAPLSSARAPLLRAARSSSSTSTAATCWPLRPLRGFRAPASCAFPTASASMRACSKATSPKKRRAAAPLVRRGGPAIPAAVPLMIRSRSELARGKESGRRPERRTAAPRVPGALRRVPA